MEMKKPPITVVCLLKAEFYFGSDKKTFFFRKFTFLGSGNKLQYKGILGKIIKPSKSGILPREDEKQL